ncbi:hypothetical protein DFH06DRAFT_718579 [Mycena polygramma]|nr:hypothetical protein DFH06DRAFT_718579 [Mycena polygramma]
MCSSLSLSPYPPRRLCPSPPCLVLTILPPSFLRRLPSTCPVRSSLSLFRHVPRAPPRSSTLPRPSARRSRPSPPALLLGAHHTPAEIPTLARWTCRSPRIPPPSWLPGRVPSRPRHSTWSARAPARLVEHRFTSLVCAGSIFAGGAKEIGIRVAKWVTIPLLVDEYTGPRRYSNGQQVGAGNWTGFSIHGATVTSTCFCTYASIHRKLT